MNVVDPYRAGGRILRIAQDSADHLALIIDNESWTYSELVAAARTVADRFAPINGSGQPITAIMAQRHVSSYVAILAARLAGHAYVPLNVNHPSQRNSAILRSSAATQIICGSNASDAMRAILDTVPEQQPTIIECGDTKADFELDHAPSSVDWPADRRCSMDDLAYILFTSGSTGQPKGVPIRNRQLEAYLSCASRLVDVRPHDVFSQTFELTFDLSVHDLFVCWENGATLVVASDKELRMPAAYVQAHHITCWFSVPSLAYQVRLQEDLVPGAFPSLRHSLFCGEALPTIVANEWLRAAPNSVVENWYGPTEATIACSRYAVSGEDASWDTVPIGKAFDNMQLLVLDSDLSPCTAETAGELFLSGEQLAEGYLNDPGKTAASFVQLPHSGLRAYRTGDRAVLGEDGNVRFLGRVDNQVKVRGFRIELGEIEAALRAASCGLNALAMAWPREAEIATSVVAALETDSANLPAIQRQLESVLPDYMLPAMIFCVPEFPKNASGKVDRRALGDLLIDEAGVDDSADASSLGPEATILLQSIRAHAPLLAVGKVLQARHLFDAGMDSLAFISVTTDIERNFGISLDQDTVIQLSEMSFGDIVREVRGETHRLESGRMDSEHLSWPDRLRKFFGIPRIIKKPRANRALQFIERFPAYLDEYGAPDVLAVGSSGMFRAFCPEEFEDAASAIGASVRTLNAGFPAVNASGMRMMCEFISSQCKRAGARVPLILYELDPMHLSTTPPSGDINLGPDFFSGNVISLSGGRTNPEFEWLVDSAGAWNAPDEARQKDRKPNWIRERDRVIAGVYLGEVEFSSQAVSDWYAGAHALQSISESLVCFIHPADREMTDELEGSCGSDKLKKLIHRVGEELDIRVLPWEAFNLEPADFLDINHMNARGGREKLSRQLATMIFTRD